MNNKVALVTGASRGIGAATAQHLAKCDYNVVINYKHNHQAAEQMVKHIVDNGGNATAIQANVAIESEVIDLFRQIDQIYGRIDALVNNAGILQIQSPVVQMNAQRINHILTTNVTSQFICCIEAVKRMSSAHGGQGGAIVNVSSAASRLGAPHEYVDYAASKAAVDTLTIGLAKEVANQGIRVNCVRPGLIYTDIHRDGGEANRVDRKGPMVPMQRGGQPHEIAAAIAWLLSDEASYATGTFIDLAGGI